MPHRQLEKMRVVLIAPLPPFGGGIAHHSLMLHEALTNAANLLTLSFSRLYPGFLYPGDNQRSREIDVQPLTGVDYLMDGVNPVTWRRALQTCEANAPDLVILPWWHIYWAPCFGYLARQLARRKIPLVFICHNVIDHDDARWKRPLTRAVLGQARFLMTHSKCNRRQLQQLVPGVPTFHHPFPTFRRLAEKGVELPRRASLELLFFGFVRHYKGLDILIDAMARLSEPMARLTVAGEFWQPLVEIEQRIERLGLAERIELIPRYVSDAEAASCFERCDIVVLPYRKAPTTGVISLAYSFGNPVIVTDVDSLPEQVIPGETGLMVPVDSADALAQAISELSPERLSTLKKGVAAHRERTSWASFAEALLAYARESRD